MNFSEKLEVVRKQLCISQEDLVRNLGVCFATVNRGEREASRLKKNLFEKFYQKNNILFMFLKR